MTEAPLHQKSIMKMGSYSPNPDQKCPICFVKVDPSSRYPNYLCRICKNRITDKEGEKVFFFNTHSMGHGCQGFYDKKGTEKYEGSVCYVKVREKTIKISASEARFGGIVLEPVYV